MSWDRMREEFWQSEMDAQTAEARRAVAYAQHETNYQNARRAGDTVLQDISLEGLHVNGTFNDWRATYETARRAGDQTARDATAEWMRAASHFADPRGPARGFGGSFV